MANALSVYRFPSHLSQATLILSRKCISISLYPSPLHSGHAPEELKLNMLGETSFSLAKSFLISSKIPMYVAGLERDDLPTPDWSISIVSFSLQKTSTINELLPDPATPVTQTNMPFGTSTDTFFKLWVLALRIGVVLVFWRSFLFTCGFDILLKYCPVRVLLLIISAGVPIKVTFPPCLPAPGPMSTIMSA